MFRKIIADVLGLLGLLLIFTCLTPAALRMLPNSRLDWAAAGGWLLLGVVCLTGGIHLDHRIERSEALTLDDYFRDLQG